MNSDIDRIYEASSENVRRLLLNAILVNEGVRLYSTGFINNNEDDLEQVENIRNIFIGLVINYVDEYSSKISYEIYIDVDKEYIEEQKEELLGYGILFGYLEPRSGDEILLPGDHLLSLVFYPSIEREEGVILYSQNISRNVSAEQMFELLENTKNSLRIFFPLSDTKLEIKNRE